MVILNQAGGVDCAATGLGCVCVGDDRHGLDAGPARLAVALGGCAAVVADVASQARSARAGFLVNSV